MIKLFVSLGIVIIYRHGGRGGLRIWGKHGFQGGLEGGSVVANQVQSRDCRIIDWSKNDDFLGRLSARYIKCNFVSGTPRR